MKFKKMIYENWFSLISIVIVGVFVVGQLIYKLNDIDNNQQDFETETKQQGKQFEHSLEVQLHRLVKRIEHLEQRSFNSH